MPITEASALHIETPTLSQLIRAANLSAEAVFCRNHQSPRDSIIAEYHSHVFAVRNYLSGVRSFIHISFDN